MEWFRGWRERRERAYLQRAWAERIDRERSANPPLRPPYEKLAQRLAQLVASDLFDSDSKWISLTDRQRERRMDGAYLDQLVASGDEPPDYLAQLVEVRSIGHGLDAEGGFELMLSVASRANAIGETRLMRAIEHYWDGIGDFQA